MKKMNKKGFTLVEMLVVIAIIAVLVSIIIPTVTTANEKAKQAADAANIRATISQVTIEGLTANETKSETVTVKTDCTFNLLGDITKKDGTDNKKHAVIGGVELPDGIAANDVLTVTYTKGTDKVTITKSGT